MCIAPGADNDDGALVTTTARPTCSVLLYNARSSPPYILKFSGLTWASTKALQHSEVLVVIRQNVAQNEAL